jgi:hypothetical protein
MIDIQESPFKNTITPFISGVIGFLIFFLMVVLIKLLSYIANQSESFQIDIKDILISVMGFGLLFLVKYFEGHNRKYF